MRRMLPVLLTLLLITLGLCALLYPLAGEWYSSRTQSRVIEQYGNALREMDNEAFTALREAAQRYNEGLRGAVVLTDPFDTDAAAARSEEYAALLDVSGAGVMGSVRIPKIGVTLPIYHGTAPKVLEKGAGHLESTSLPIGGTGTHTVLSAHSGLPGSVLFTNLETLAEGDLFFLDVLEETMAYRVDRIVVVVPDDVSGLLIDNAADYATLVTCTPYGINSHRLLVRGTRTEYAETREERAAPVPEPAAGSAWLRPYLAAGTVLVLLLALGAGIRAGKIRRARKVARRTNRQNQSPRSRGAPGQGGK